MRQPRVRIDDLTENTDGLIELADHQLDLIVGGMVNDGNEVSSLFEWDLSSYGFGLSGGGGGAPDGGAPAPAPRYPGDPCRDGFRREPFELYQPGTPLPMCTLIAQTTKPDAGGGVDSLAN